MGFEQSEVARFRQRVEQEEASARLGLTGFAIVAKHDAINARATRGAERILQLMEQGQHVQAHALMDRPDWGADEYTVERQTEKRDGVKVEVRR